MDTARLRIFALWVTIGLVLIALFNLFQATSTRPPRPVSNTTTEQFEFTVIAWDDQGNVAQLLARAKTLAIAKAAYEAALASQDYPRLTLSQGDHILSDQRK